MRYLCLKVERKTHVVDNIVNFVFDSEFVAVLVGLDGAAAGREYPLSREKTMATKQNKFEQVDFITLYNE